MASTVILAPFYLNYLPLAQFGALSVYTTFSMFVQVLITYSFDSTLYVYFHDYKKDPRRLAEFVSSAFIFMMITTVVVGLAAIGAGSLLFDRLFEGKAISFYPFGLMSVVTAAFQAFFKVYNTLLQSSEKPVLFFWSNLVSFFFIAAFTVGGLLIFPDTLIGPVGGKTLAAGISFAWVLLKVFREFGFHFNFSLLRTSFGYNNTSFIYQLQQWGINYFDRLLMTLYLALSVVGAYDFAFKCMLLIDFVVSGLYNSFFPKVIAMVIDQPVKETTVTINRYYHSLMAVVMLLVCLSILLFPMLVDLGLIRHGYDEAMKYIPFLGLVYLARGVRYYFSFPYAALKYPGPLPFIYGIVSALKIGLMVVFMARFGVYAVIASAFISTLVEVVLLRWAIRKRFQFHMNPYKMILAPLALAALIMLTEILERDAPHAYLRHAFYAVFCASLLWLLYRKELKMIRPSTYFR